MRCAVRLHCPSHPPSPGCPSLRPSVLPVQKVTELEPPRGSLSDGLLPPVTCILGPPTSSVADGSLPPRAGQHSVGGQSGVCGVTTGWLGAQPTFITEFTSPDRRPQECLGFCVRVSELVRLSSCLHLHRPFFTPAVRPGLPAAWRTAAAHCPPPWSFRARWQTAFCAMRGHDLQVHS